MNLIIILKVSEYPFKQSKNVKKHESAIIYMFLFL